MKTSFSRDGVLHYKERPSRDWSADIVWALGWRRMMKPENGCSLSPEWNQEFPAVVFLKEKLSIKGLMSLL